MDLPSVRCFAFMSAVMYTGSGLLRILLKSMKLMYCSRGGMYVVALILLPCAVGTDIARKSE